MQLAMIRAVTLLLALAATFDLYAYGQSSAGVPAGSTCTVWNYTMTHNSTTPETVALAATQLTDLPPSDDAVAAVALPFNFTFYGQSYDSIEVSTNGNIQFVTTSIAWVDSIFPINLSTPTQQVPILAMYYVDLNPDQDYMQQTAVIGAPGTRQVLVRYNQVPVCPFDQSATHNDTSNDTSLIDSQPSVTCDVVLYEIDSHIDIRYYNIDPTPWPVDVGVQGSGANDWTAAVNHEPMTEAVVQFLANSTVTFTPQCQSYITAPGGGMSSSFSTAAAASTGATSSASVGSSAVLLSNTAMSSSSSAQQGMSPSNSATVSAGAAGLVIVALLALQLQLLLW